jgi:hypothetical protein
MPAAASVVVAMGGFPACAGHDLGSGAFFE